jgi:hypothetical protein
MDDRHQPTKCAIINEDYSAKPPCKNNVTIGGYFQPIRK